MRVIKQIVFCAAFVFTGSTFAYACVCGQIDRPIKTARNYYKTSFKGAIFTGKIRTIEDLPLAKDDELAFPMREMVIDIERFWLGVSSPQIKVLTFGENTSCTIDWPTGKVLFFIASKGDDGRLHVGPCDLVDWKGEYPNKEWADYTKLILGEPKSFQKK